MFPRHPVLLFGALFLVSFASCQPSIEQTSSRAARQALYASQNLLGGRLRSKQTTLENAVVEKEVEGAMCSWATRASSCDMSQSALAGHLAKCNNAFAQFVAQFTSCEAAKDKASCKSSDNCLWDEAEKRCYFVEVTSGQEDSPCYIAAPGYTQILAHAPVCRTMSSSRVCSKDPLCLWQEDERCWVDTFQLLCGVPTSEVLDAMDQIAIYGMFVYMFDLTLHVDLFDPAFDEWERVLAWKPPKIACPEDVHPKAWEFAQAQMARLMPHTYYCVLKYTIPEHTEECNQDPYCYSNVAEGTCELSMTQAEAEARVYEDMLPLMDADLDRHIMKGFADCRRADEKKCNGKCLWIPQLGQCLPKEEWTFEEIAAIDKSGDDALCKYFKLESNSGCRDNVPPQACSEMQQCQWRDLDQVCLATSKYLMKGALDSDPDENSAIDMLQHHCQNFVAKSECLAASAQVVT